MRLVGALAACLIATAATAQPSTGNTQPDPTGEWLVAEKLARIKIVDCGGQIWGVVAWESTPGGVDRKNPDPNLRTRPTLGMPILLGMTQSKPNQWDGEIYNSEDGHTYSASITLKDPTTLRVQGCFLGFLCGGQNWTRYIPPDVPGDTQAKVPPPKTPPARGPAPNTRKPATAANQPDPTADDVCLRLFGVPGLPHQGGLK
jgi:uncharacterized protein (DUF2147 family)